MQASDDALNREASFHEFLKEQFSEWVERAWQKDRNKKQTVSLLRGDK